MSAITVLLHRTCLVLPATLVLAACSRDVPPTLAQVHQAMKTSATTFIQEAYQEALQAHDMDAVRSIVNQTDYDIHVTDLSKCESSNTEEDTNAHWRCHIKGDITLNSKHYPIDSDLDFYYSMDQRTWQMQR